MSSSTPSPLGPLHTHHVRLTYFDSPWIAEPIRLALRLGGVPFTDERLPSDDVGYAEVARRRAAGELGFSGVVPVLQLTAKDGSRKTTYSQSAAILRFVGRECYFGASHDSPALPLYPIDDSLLQFRCDEVEEALAEIRARLLPAHYRAAQPRSLKTGKPCVPLTDAQYDELMQALNTDILPSKLQRVEKILLDGMDDHVTRGAEQAQPGWFLGHRLSICDLSCYTMIHALQSLCNAWIMV